MISITPKTPRLPFSLRRMVLLNAIVATAVTLIVWSFQSGMQPSVVLTIFGFTFAFTNLFGIPSAYILARLGERLPRLGAPYDWIAVTFQILSFSIVGTLLGLLILRAMGFSDGVSLWRQFWAALRLAVVVSLTVGLGIYAWMSKKAELDEARREIERRELAENQALRALAEARLASLESRVRPHFLFNTLNSIAALIPEDPVRAEGTVQRLAALLRFSLDSSRERLVGMDRECRMVVDYLEIERARFGERLRFDLDLDPDAMQALVPPLALQTIAENSIKHVAATRRAGVHVRVAVRRAPGEVVAQVCDDGPGFTWSDVKPGHGLDNLRDRLTGLFGDAARLEIVEVEEGGACLRLHLPLSASPSEEGP